MIKYLYIFVIFNIFMFPAISFGEVDLNNNLGLYLASDGTLMHNNKVYRGIGVNYFDAFSRDILSEQYKKTENLSYQDGFDYLSANKIPFIRFSVNGYWPSEWQLYLKNKQLYFEQLDKFVKSAEQHNIGLIPSFFWNAITISDLVGEHKNQWGNPNSKTIAFMKGYTAEIIQRYKNSPAIWGWEFGNEVNGSIDMLDQAKNYRPQVSPTQGTPTTRTIDDAFTTDDLVVALNNFAETVRKYDKNRIIMSGNSIFPSNAYHRYKFKSWSQDSTEDHKKMLIIQNPADYVLTTHIYPDEELKYFNGDSTFAQIIAVEKAAAIEVKKPLFVGEFGAPIDLGETIEKKKFNELLSAILDNQVPLASLWVFDFSYQNSTWNVTPTNARKYQLDAVIKANDIIRSQLK